MPLFQTAIVGFREYPKIQTLFERDKSSFLVDPSKLKAPVLGTIHEWNVTEKIDGTNIRIMLSVTGEVSFGGRTNAAMIPADLVQSLIQIFQQDRLKSVMWRDGEPAEAVLYGEGYGRGIQKNGGLYRIDKGFILFDVLVGGKWWLERDAVEDIARGLAIDAVPDMGIMSIPEIVELVRTPFRSSLGNATAEGIVARPIATLFDRRMERVIIKLKTKDFVLGRR